MNAPTPSSVVVRQGRLRVACNLSATPVTVPPGRIGRILLASEPVEGTGGELKPAPESFAIVLASPE